MAWIKIPNTNLEYDDNAYNNLPENRKSFWDKQSNITISNGIRTKSNGIEIYMRVKDADENVPVYFESEYNKTYLDNK